MNGIEEKIKSYTKVIENEIIRVKTLKLDKSKSKREREYWLGIIKGLLVDLNEYRRRYARKTMSIEDLIRMFFGDDFFEEI